MKAAWFEKFGKAADVLFIGEQARPAPAHGQVLVRLATSGVNPSDVKKRAGSSPNLLDEGRVIPHSDGAGVIEAVGHGVSTTRIGERVWVYQAQHERRFGTAAQYVALDSSRAPSLNEDTSFEVGACIGIPIMTAHRCVFADGPVSGQTILVTGGAGRVAHYAIQLAKLAGARVITTASEADQDTCWEAGADAIVNHHDENWSAAVLDANKGEKVDRVVEVEFGANLSQVLEVIRNGATVATYSSTQVTEPKLPFYRMMFMDLTLKLVIVYAMPESAKRQAIADIDRHLRKDRLQHRIAHVIPFDQVARSHELIEQGGFRGCVVVSTK